MNLLWINGNQPRQFTDEQRTFCILKFESYGPGKGRYSSYPRIKKEFEEKFPGVSAPRSNTKRNLKDVPEAKDSPDILCERTVTSETLSSLSSDRIR